MVQEAERALGAVLLFHDSAVERGLRKGVAWDGVRKDLVDRLQGIQLDELSALPNWESSREFANRLAEAYAGQSNIQTRIASLMARFVRESLKEENYELTNSRLQLLEAQFPKNADLEQIHEQLRSRARTFMEQARVQESQGKLQEA